MIILLLIVYVLGVVGCYDAARVGQTPARSAFLALIWPVAFPIGGVITLVNAWWSGI